MLAKQYEERYKRHLKQKEKLYSVQLPKETSKPKIDSFKATKSLCQSTQDDDQPIKLEKDPFKNEMYQCIFCKYNIPIDYKNVQLLSQFVSPHTGIMYSQQVTGLCHYKYIELEKTIFKAKKLGLMPFFYKETTFIDDPVLFNQFKNNLKQIPNNYDKRKFNSDE
jgi:small subunit ribosomal protein S18